MSKLDEITRESWILKTFPEWGSWLNEEIEEEVVEANSFAMWWLGCTGIWIKTHENCNISIDYWNGSGKRTKQVKDMVKGHQMANMCGCRKLQPNLRASISVLDPFLIKDVDAVLATHYHQDHMDINYTAAVLKNIDKRSLYWTKNRSIFGAHGVPEERLVVVKPGDSIKIKTLVWPLIHLTAPVWSPPMVTKISVTCPQRYG